MKKTILYIAMAFVFWACQQGYDEIPDHPGQREEEKTPVSFNIAMPADISYGTDIIPMSRATDDTIRTFVNNPYKAIIIKKIQDNWFVDTVLTPLLDANKHKGDELAIYKNTVPDPLQVELRPGTYKIGIVLNHSTLFWNRNIKNGTFVATDADLQAGKNVLRAYKIPIKGENFDTHQPTDGNLIIYKEVFAGRADFQVEKNTQLGTTNTHTAVPILVERKVSRLRYLLKISQNTQPNKNGNFGGTAYWLHATLKAKTGEYFCEGLDVLGKPYYANRTSLNIYCSVTPDSFYSEKDGNYYQMPANIHRDFAHGGEGILPTDYAPFILTDKDMECTFKIEQISGASQGYIFHYAPEFFYFLPANGINGFAVEKDPSSTGVKDENNNSHYDALLIDGIDVTKSFPDSYEFNAIPTQIPKP